MEELENHVNKYRLDNFVSAPKAESSASQLIVLVNAWTK